MTNDFQLFADPADGVSATDPDVSLLAAYLAHELSPVQVAAVEERLTVDAEFRATADPILDAWFAPGSLGALSSPVSAPVARPTAPAHESRRRTMSRIAAVIAISILPALGLAQLAVYVANHSSAPGHDIVRAVIDRDRPVLASSEPRQTVGKAEGPIPRALALAPRDTRSAAVPPTAIGDGVPTLSNTQEVVPNRAKIVALVKQHHPRVTSGEQSADYVVMVVDAAEKYLWSTSATGTFWVQVNGDSRTSAQRDALESRYGGEFAGPAGPLSHSEAPVVTIRALLAPFRDNTPLYVIDGVPLPSVYTTSADFAGLAIDDVRVIRGAEAARLYGSRASGGVILITTKAAAMRADSIARAHGGVASRGGAVTRSVPDSGASPSPPRGPYTMGWGSPRLGAGGANQGPGLEEVGRSDRAGIVGVADSSVSRADFYTFRAGELAPALLRVVVVHLVPGTIWTPR